MYNPSWHEPVLLSETLWICNLIMFMELFELFQKWQITVSRWLSNLLQFIKKFIKLCKINFIKIKSSDLNV